MVSSSPPPIDDAIEEDEDEFGDFAVADDSSNNAADDPETPVKSPTFCRTFWQGDLHRRNEIELGVEYEMKEGLEYETKDFGRVVDDMHQDSIMYGATDSGLCSASQNSDGVSPSPVGPEVCRDETLVSSVSTDVEPQRVCGVTVAEAFQTDAQYGRERMTHDADDGDDFGDFTNGVMIEEFAVFESPLLDGPAGSWAAVTRPVPAAIDDYDFDDFETAEFQCAPVNCVGFDNSKLTQKLQALIDILFPLTNSINFVEMSVAPLAERLATVWLKLQDMDHSHALSYQWSGSTTSKGLLVALGIDSRNILFGPRWNSSVPRFAANLGFIPLEPMQASHSSVTPQEPAKELATEEAATEETVVPAAEFDWINSGLVNPLDSPKASTSDSLIQQVLLYNQCTPVTCSRQGLSPEAVRVLDELPDLSFLQAKLLMFPVQGTLL